MKETIINSTRIVNANLLLVIMAGMSSIRIYSGVMTIISIIGLLVSFLIGIVVYGRIVARIKGESPSPVKILIKDHWLNYMLVGIVLAIPTLLFSQLPMSDSLSVESMILTKEGLNSIVHMVTIYVLPIVFIKKENLVAIMSGVLLLFQNLKGSLHVIALVALISFVNITLSMLLFKMILPGSNVYSLIPIMVLVNIVFTYLSFMIFAAATVNLIKPNANAY
ncbi:MAG: hypothetical protein ABW088_14155 [Sedimenticola sp.]